MVESEMYLFSNYLNLLEDEIRLLTVRVRHYTVLSQNLVSYILDKYGANWMGDNPKIIQQYPEIMGFGMKIVEMRKELELLRLCRIKTINTGKICLLVGIIETEIEVDY